MSVTQAILPVAGLGTRFLPWTKSVPKEMLPIGNQPIIAKIVDECLDAGIKDICFVIAKGKEVIPEYFQEDSALLQELARRGKEELLQDFTKYDEVNFHTVYQDEQLGDGHAILQAKDWITSESVAVLFADDLFVDAAPGLRQLLDVYTEGALVALENIDRSATEKYGIVDPESSDGRLHTIKGLVEKPHPDDAPSTLGIVGRYILPKSTFDALPEVGASHGGEIRTIDALISQLGSIPIAGLECEGKRIDTGTPEGYKDAVALLG